MYMYNACMPVALQIRDVPEAVRDVLAGEANQRGQSMQALLLSLITAEAKALTNAEAFARTSAFRADLRDWDLVALIQEGRADGYETDRSDR